MTFACSTETARELSARLTASALADQNEASMLATLQEMTNIIAGRVRNSFKDRHTAVNCTLPDSRRVAKATKWPVREQGHRSDCFFRVRNADLGFHLALACREGASAD